MSKKQSKKEPSIINLSNGSAPIKGETCFGTYKKLGVPCNVEECRYNQEMGGAHQNCIINASQSGPFTLQEVGDIFSVTRMRICQIEKIAKQVLGVSMSRE